jgi:hypothetical protein
MKSKQPDADKCPLECSQFRECTPMERGRSNCPSAARIAAAPFSVGLTPGGHLDLAPVAALALAVGTHLDGSVLVQLHGVPGRERGNVSEDTTADVATRNEPRGADRSSVTTAFGRNQPE